MIMIYLVIFAKYTGGGKSEFTVVCVENNTVIKTNNTRINSKFCVLTGVNLLLPHM